MDADKCYTILSVCIKSDISAGDIVSGMIALLGVAAAMLTFVLQSRKGDKLQKIEIYQGLEMASSDVFSFEAEHGEVLERYRNSKPIKFTALEMEILRRFEDFENGAPPAGMETAPDIVETYRRIEREIRIVRKYYEKTMNLFEVSARFRRGNIFEPAIFGSWVIWYYETCQEWSFRWWWPDLHFNYVAELRNIFDYPVAAFDFESDEADEERIKRDFFLHVAKLYNCKLVAGWLDDVDRGEKKLARDVLKHGVPTYRKQGLFGGSTPMPGRHTFRTHTIESPFLDDAVKQLRSGSGGQARVRKDRLGKRS